MKPINEYPIFCYLIYIFSCFVTRYNLWLSTEKVLDKKKFDPNIQGDEINMDNYKITVSENHNIRFMGSMLPLSELRPRFKKTNS